MSRWNVRLRSVSIHDFKSVEAGKIELREDAERQTASILGVYGQNGSGKTTLVDAICMLKYLLSGMRVPTRYVGYIMEGKEQAGFEFEFSIEGVDARYTVWYGFTLGKREDFVDETDDEMSVLPTIENEIISYSCISDGKKLRKTPLINTNTQGVFVPISRYSALVGDMSQVDLLVEKKIAGKESRSFLFSRSFLEVINDKCSDDVAEGIFNRLNHYGIGELFVVNTQDIGLIRLDALPVYFRMSEGNRRSVGAFPIMLSEDNPVPLSVYRKLQQIMENMNVVLKRIIPDMMVKAEEIGKQLLENGEEGYLVGLKSVRGDREIPLRYESDGIKKILSILQLLIVMFNRYSFTLVIDELDSGVFEYLLGELLDLLSHKGKGQLIFTSHNLRPLETIDKKSVIFTTTNPSNRFIRMKNVKTNHNLRDFYYRGIELGGQDDDLYEETNSYEIELALRKAGDLLGAKEN